MQTVTGTSLPVLPQNLEAESALLGSMILRGEAVGEVMEILDKEDFYRPAHKRLFEVLVTLFMDHHVVDTVIVKNELEKRGLLDDIGGPDYLAELIDTVPSAANATYYARIVRERATLRHVIQACDTIIREARDSTESVDELVDRAERLIFEAARRRGGGAAIKIGDILKETFHRITDIRDRKNRITGLPSGFYELDEMLSGFHPAQFIVIAGRPSMGKTSLALKVIESIGLDQGQSVLFFSLEMASPQIAETMLCSHCRINTHNLRRGLISEEEFQKLLLAAGRFQESRIMIDDSSDMTVLDIRARARRLKAEHDIQCVVVDYLQLISASRQTESRQQEIAMISRALKALAKELNVPVIALSQLNRAAEGREDHRPRLADLRESGAIEQDADVVLLLYRDEYYNTNTDRKGICDITVAKNRSGPTGEFGLAFLNQFVRFENLSATQA